MPKEVGNQWRTVLANEGDGPANIILKKIVNQPKIHTKHRLFPHTSILDALVFHVDWYRFKFEDFVCSCTISFRRWYGVGNY